MRLTIAVHGHLQHTSAVGQDEMTLTFPDGDAIRVRDILEILNIFEEEVHALTINGRKARVDSALRGRARVEIFPRERRLVGASRMGPDRM